MGKDGAGKHLFDLGINKVTYELLIPYSKALSNMVVIEIQFYNRGDWQS